MEWAIRWVMHGAAIALALISCRSCWVFTNHWLILYKGKVRKDAESIMRCEVFQTVFRPHLHNTMQNLFCTTWFKQQHAKFKCTQCVTDAMPLVKEIYMACVIPPDVRHKATQQGAIVLHLQHMRLSEALCQRYIHEAYYTANLPQEFYMEIIQMALFAVGMAGMSHFGTSNCRGQYPIGAMAVNHTNW